MDDYATQLRFPDSPRVPKNSYVVFEHPRQAPKGFKLLMKSTLAIWFLLVIAGVFVLIANW